MKKPLIIFLTASCLIFSQTTINTIDFEVSGLGYTVTNQFDDGMTDYFTRTNDVTRPSAGNYTNSSGYYFGVCDNDETGVGICRPIDSEEQYNSPSNGCGLCSDPINEVFGACTPETCSLYGDCYLLKGDPFLCTHKKEISCWDFASWSISGNPSENNCNSTTEWRNRQLLGEDKDPANVDVGTDRIDKNEILRCLLDS